MSRVPSVVPGAWLAGLLIAAELLLFIGTVALLEAARGLDDAVIAITTAFLLSAVIAVLLARLITRGRPGGRDGS